MTIPPSYLDIGMSGHFEGCGGCKGFVVKAVKKAIAKRIFLSGKAMRITELTANS